MTSGCRSLTCPSPEPYINVQRRDGISAAICQLRSVKSQGELNAGKFLAARHAMCRPSGCKNLFLQPATVRGRGANVVAIAVRVRELVDSLGGTAAFASWRHHAGVIDKHLTPAHKAFPLVLVPARGLFANAAQYLNLGEEIGTLPSGAVVSADAQGAATSTAGAFRVYAVPLVEGPSTSTARRSRAARRIRSQ